MREDAGPGGALDDDLQTVRQHVAMAAGPAVLAVVVNRMVVAAGQLEGGEHRFGLGPRVYVELLADLEVLEPVRRSETMLFGPEWGGFGHVLPPAFAGTLVPREQLGQLV